MRRALGALLTLLCLRLNCEYLEHHSHLGPNVGFGCSIRARKKSRFHPTSLAIGLQGTFLSSPCAGAVLERPIESGLKDSNLETSCNYLCVSLELLNAGRPPCFHTSTWECSSGRQEGLLPI